MKESLKKDLETVRKTLAAAQRYEHAVHVLNYDMETICPPDAIEEQGGTMAYLETEGYRLIKTDEFITAADRLYENRHGSGPEAGDGLDEYDLALAERLHRDRQKTKYITPELNHEFALVYNKAFADWLKAKNASDFSLFAPSLLKVREVDQKSISLREEKKDTPYDHLLDDYERGMTQADLDEIFGQCKERLIPFLRKILAGKKQIRTDFMHRTVTDEQQRKMARFLLEEIGFDFSRGAFTTTEHPFTDDLARNDVRVTTHYYPDYFASSMYSIIHEGGHAVFGQNQPEIHHDRFIANQMTLGMHESVSRFYENRIGRSREFIDRIFEKTKEIFPEVMSDVTAREFYEAVNEVKPSLIRTEADEFTYTFHIIIRYEIEKEIVNGNPKTEDLPALWNRKYEEYLGICPPSDKEGILQDVHWTSGFGYFPTYALGNMYNAMYWNCLKQEMDLPGCIRSGSLLDIRDWMSKRVFAKANILSPKEWIRDITGREFTPKDFLDYLEEKYGELYDL